MPDNQQPSGDLPDKQYLYGRYRDWEGWRNSLAKKLSHKALDIMPDDEMEVNQYHRSGIGWKELAVVAAAGVGGLAAWQHFGSRDDPQAPPAAVAPAGPWDSEYEVRFYDKDGTPIDVPHISKRPEPGT